MNRRIFKKIGASVLGAAMLCSSVAVYTDICIPPICSGVIMAEAADTITLDNMPEEYKGAADWIWNNRIVNENSMGSKNQRFNTIFDQIIAGEGTLNFVVRWQSYKTVTYEQRQQFEKLASDCVNAWTDWLVGYENWPYKHVDVNVVGWAVIDKSCLLDLHDDEIVYTDTEYYDAKNDTSNGYETIPDRLPLAPSELSRFDHFADRSYQYPGGLDKRFDMYLWCTQGFPAIGGCGGDWGQRLSDDAYINMLDGSGIHVLEHEIGHGFGITDFYGGEGESDGFPPGGFPGGGTSIMMAGSSAEITDFDGWLLRYMWTHIKDESGRFEIKAPVVTEPPVTTIATTTASPIVTTTSAPERITDITFSDKITGTGDGFVTFEKAGTFLYSGDYYDGDESRNLAHYEVGDSVKISLRFSEESREIMKVNSLTLLQNVRDEKPDGDVNSDDLFDIADLVTISRYLLGSGTMADWKAGDLCIDERIDSYDLKEMRALIVSGN